MTASVDEVICYEVNESIWSEALAKYGSEEIALDELRGHQPGSVNTVSYEAEVDEVHNECECSVMEI